VFSVINNTRMLVHVGLIQSRNVHLQGLLSNCPAFTKALIVQLINRQLPQYLLVMYSRLKHNISPDVRTCRKQTVVILSSDSQLVDRVSWNMTSICNISVPDLQNTQTSLAPFQHLVVFEQSRIGDEETLQLLAIFSELPHHRHACS
jgi:hypothetical protein